MYVYVYNAKHKYNWFFFYIVSSSQRCSFFSIISRMIFTFYFNTEICLCANFTLWDVVHIGKKKKITSFIYLILFLYYFLNILLCMQHFWKWGHQVSPRTAFCCATAGSHAKCLRPHWRSVLTTPTWLCPGGGKGCLHPQRKNGGVHHLCCWILAVTKTGA